MKTKNNIEKQVEVVNKVLDNFTKDNGVHLQRWEYDEISKNIEKELKKLQPLSLMDWVAENYGDDPDFVGEENLMFAYEDENILNEYKEYLYEQFN